MKPTLGIRHLVLWVRDPQRSAEFYRDALGLEIKAQPTRKAVFMSSPDSATDHDLGLFEADSKTGPIPGAVGMYHVAWEVATLEDLREAKQRMLAMGALVGENNHGASRSLYCKDPDGNEFEIMWEVPEHLLDEDEESNVPLDFETDGRRFGMDAPGRGLVDSATWTGSQAR